MIMENNKNVILIIGMISIMLVLSSSVTLHAQDLDMERLAQYNLNYASYLIDVGKYLEALDGYETAYEVTQYPKTKAKALLHKASLLANFLDNFDESLKTYDQILKEYPEFGETALYKKGLLLFDLQRYEEAINAFDQYMKDYPEGIQHFSVEILRRKALEAIGKPLPPEPKPFERPSVRVALAKKTRSAVISGKDLEAIAGGKIEARGDNLTIEFSDPGIKINNKVVNAFRIEIRGASPPITLSISNQKKSVRGSLNILRKDGSLRIINVVDIEEYLYGVVPSESIASWPIETLKAQAVAARTYAIYQINHRKDWDYDLVDYAGDQSYKGVLREHPRSTKAVEESAGLIMEYNGRPIFAMYTANSGGITADPQYIFSMKQPYLFSQDDPASTKGSQATWSKSYSISEIEEKLKTVGCDLKGIRDIQPHTTSPSGRVIKVKIIHSKGETVLRTWSTLRRALKLREILLKTERRGDTIYFKVKGHGHGIGYSQEGGAILGKTEEFRKILSFYYPKAELVKRWQ